MSPESRIFLSDKPKPPPMSVQTDILPVYTEILCLVGSLYDYKNPEVVIMVKIRKKPYKHNPYPEISNVNIFIDSIDIYGDKNEVDILLDCKNIQINYYEPKELL